MSNYDKFRNFQNSGLVVNNNRDKEFLTKSKSSRTVFHIPVNVERTAVMTNSYKEGGDEFIMFTENLEVKAENVCIGDYIESEEVSYLVYSEYNHPRKDIYIKQRLIECNQVISFDMLEQPVYYISSLRRFVEASKDSSAQMLSLGSGAKPLLITRDNEEFTTDSRFMIIDEAFEIVEIDRKSNPGIAYLSVQPTTIMSEDDLNYSTTYKYPDTEGIPGLDRTEMSGGRVLAGSTITDTTFNGIVSFSTPVKVLSRTATSVIWQAPMREGEIIVTVSDGGIEPINVVYQVVI